MKSKKRMKFVSFTIWTITETMINFWLHMVENFWNLYYASIKKECNLEKHREIIKMGETICN